MKKQILLLTLLLGLQSAWADSPLLTFRIPDNADMKLEGTVTSSHGRVYFQDGRTCDRCTVGSIGGFVTSITDKAGNKWPLTPGIVQVDPHPLRSSYLDSMRQYNTLWVQQQSNNGMYMNPALQMMRWQNPAQPSSASSPSTTPPQNKTAP